jgi:hypothetical protein
MSDNQREQHAEEQRAAPECRVAPGQPVRHAPHAQHRSKRRQHTEQSKRQFAMADHAAQRSNQPEIQRGFVGVGVAVEVRNQPAAIGEHFAYHFTVARLVLHPQVAR